MYQRKFLHRLELFSLWPAIKLYVPLIVSTIIQIITHESSMITHDETR